MNSELLDSSEASHGRSGEPSRAGSAYWYVVLMFLGVAWLWHTQLGLPSSAEAVGYDLGSVVLPLLLLWFASVRVVRNRRLAGSPAPRLAAWGFFCAASAVMAGIDSFAGVRHEIGALMLTVMFGIAAIVLFVSERAARRSSVSAPQGATDPR
jgi:hypothetical protein